MTDLQISQIAVALFVAVTPWCVVRIVLAVARRHARSVNASLAWPPAMRSMNRATAGALLAAAAAGVWFQPPSLGMAAVDWALFAGLAIVALRTLGELAEAARPSVEATELVRVASLQPRRLRDYVPPFWRATLFTVAALALASFAWRVMLPGPDRRLLPPIAFATFPFVFAWLYEVWMRDLAIGGESPTDGDAAVTRRRRIRAVFAVETLLVVACLAVAHALLDVDWNRHAAWGAAAALLGSSVGVVGCALLISSGLARRRYRTA
jgi:hypothetical protein